MPLCAQAISRARKIAECFLLRSWPSPGRAMSLNGISAQGAVVEVIVNARV